MGEQTILDKLRGGCFSIWGINYQFMPRTGV